MGSCRSILDLGCGDDSPISFLATRARKIVGVDIFEPSLRNSIANATHSSYVRADVRTLCFKDRVFEGVLASHLLEQVPKEDGRNLLRAIPKLATRKVVIICPNGYLARASEFGNPYGSNLSGWTPSELVSFGFKVFGLSGLKQLRRGRYVRNHLRYDPMPPLLGDLLAFITTPLTYFFPRFAFILLGVKDV